MYSAYTFNIIFPAFGIILLYKYWLISSPLVKLYVGYIYHNFSLSFLLPPCFSVHTNGHQALYMSACSTAPDLTEYICMATLTTRITSVAEAGATDFSAATMGYEHDFLSSEVSATFFTVVTKYLACSHLRVTWFIISYHSSSYHPSQKHGDREGGREGMPAVVGGWLATLHPQSGNQE